MDMLGLTGGHDKPEKVLLEYLSILMAFPRHVIVASESILLKSGFGGCGF